MGIRDANQKVRRLMFKLASMTTTIPKSLYIADINIDINATVIGMGGSGRVFTGEHKGQQVALKMLYMARYHVSALSSFLTFRQY